MHSSRLYELFQSLEPSELKDLRKFVRSPFFNQRAHVVALFDFLEQARKNGSTVDRKLAFARLWPRIAYDDHKLRLSMSLLVKTIEQYLIWQQANHSIAAQQLLLAKAFGQRGLDRHFQRSTRRLDQQLAQQPLRDANYFQQRYQLHLERYQFNSRQNRMKGFPLEEVETNFDIAYLAAKLKQSCLMLSHQAIYNKAYDFGMLAEAIAFIEEKGYLKQPAISVYYYAYHALTAQEEGEYFAIFKSQIFEHQSLFSKADIRDLFLLATNYCIQKLNQGYQDYAREGLDIYQEGLKSELLLQQGRLSNFTYSNIVAKAIVCKEFSWASDFIENYRHLLAPSIQESSYAYNLAWLKYEQKDYDAALELLQRSHFSDTLLSLSAKTIALKIYFELEAFELLSSHLDAMRSFLNRKKLLAYHRQNYANTIKYTKKILDLPPYDAERRSQLQQEIKATASVAEKKWLLRQLAPKGLA
ncbi:MAG: hypothetical protein AAF433_22895 [Bacteroidota bacterium]